MFADDTTLTASGKSIPDVEVAINFMTLLTLSSGSLQTNYL
jgi:hypothetical protein